MTRAPFDRDEVEGFLWRAAGFAGGLLIAHGVVAVARLARRIFR